MVVNPKGNKKGVSRMYRGGSWDDVNWGCRVTCRIGESSSKFGDQGFRIVLG